MKHIRHLEKTLLKYEKVIPFDPKKSENLQYEDKEEENKEKSEIEHLKDEIKKLKEKIKQMESQKETTNVPLIVPELQIFEPKEVDQMKTLRTIGRGAQSEVFEVSQERHLALKVLLAVSPQTVSKSKSKKKSKNDNNKDLQRFIQEYKILNNLCHRNIIRTYGFCFGDKTHAPSILLQFCPNDLDDIVKDMSDIERICCIFEISSGMEAVHSSNLIHRDLKPNNILIDEKGHVRIADFGLSCLIDVENQLQSPTAGIGTYKFMAPELLNESTHYTNKVDVFSFGVVVFYILTGGEMPKIKMCDQSNGKKANIPRNINKVSRQLINKCWEKDAESRLSFTEINEYIKNNHFELINGAGKNIEEIKAFLSL